MVLKFLFIFNIIFAIVVVFYERKNPAVTWAWLMVLLFIPYFGFIVYLILGLDSRKQRIFSQKAAHDEYTLKGLKPEHFSPQLKEDETNNDLVYLNSVSGNGLMSQNNHIRVFHNGNDKFEAMLQDISGAKYFIHMQYYIFRGDDLGQRVISALTQKAREGVKVRLLIDGMGSLSLTRKYYKPLLEAGGQVAIFLPPYFVRLNFRNHRKICVIDDEIGYVGGFNVGDEYLGISKRFGYWRDSHIAVQGDAAKALNLRFVMDWNFASSEKISCDLKLSKEAGGVPMQIVSSGPDTKWPMIHYAYCKMISEANHSIYMQSPYFVPDDSILEALRIAALSGIDVRIMIPAHPDHPFVYWAAISYLGELIKAGVKCYKYEKGFVHSKLVMIDGKITSVGTANVDVRSFKLNFEVNAFIYDREITEEFVRQFFVDLDDCTEMLWEWYNSRSNITKIKESISRLLSPLL